MQLVLDVRERGLAAALTAAGTPFMTASLEVGDLVIQQADGTPLLVAERKSLADFAASNNDGRYREQRARLMAVRGSGVAVVYLLEGRWTGSDEAPVGGTRTTEGALRRLTTRLVLRYGLPVLATADIQATAKWVRTLLDQLTDDVAVFQPEGDMATAQMAAMASMTAVLSTTKKGNKTANGTAAAMLSAVPGLGAKRVETILAEKSLAELATMSAAELAGLVAGGKRLGEKLGATLAEALRARG